MCFLPPGSLCLLRLRATTFRPCADPPNGGWTAVVVDEIAFADWSLPPPRDTSACCIAIEQRFATAPTTAHQHAYVDNFLDVGPGSCVGQSRPLVSNNQRSERARCDDGNAQASSTASRARALFRPLARRRVGSRVQPAVNQHHVHGFGPTPVRMIVKPTGHLLTAAVEVMAVGRI